MRQVCVLVNPPGDSDKHSSGRTTAPGRGWQLCFCEHGTRFQTVLSCDSDFKVQWSSFLDLSSSSPSELFVVVVVVFLKELPAFIGKYKLKLR